MSENTKSAWGNGDEAEKAAAETKGMDRKVADLETRSEGEKPGTFAEMLRAMAKAAGQGSDEPELTPEAQIERLKVFAQRSATPAADRFKIGDVVTASANTYLKDAGKPAIVLEIRSRAQGEGSIDTAKYPGSSEVEPGGNQYGLLFDMRVLKIRHGDVFPLWVESWTFEPWTPSTAKAT